MRDEGNYEIKGQKCEKQQVGLGVGFRDWV